MLGSDGPRAGGDCPLFACVFCGKTGAAGLRKASRITTSAAIEKAAIPHSGPCMPIKIASQICTNRFEATFSNALMTFATSGSARSYLGYFDGVLA